MPYLMRDENGNVCPKCGGSGVKRNLATLSPSDDEPCSCTERNDDEETDEQASYADLRASGGIFDAP